MNSCLLPLKCIEINPLCTSEQAVKIVVNISVVNFTKNIISKEHQLYSTLSSCTNRKYVESLQSKHKIPQQKKAHSISFSINYCLQEFINEAILISPLTIFEIVCKVASDVFCPVVVFINVKLVEWVNAVVLVLMVQVYWNLNHVCIKV